MAKLMALPQHPALSNLSINAPTSQKKALKFNVATYPAGQDAVAGCLADESRTRHGPPPEWSDHPTVSASVVFGGV